MRDQAATLRNLMGEPQRFAKVVTFASGKGGVGKSNLSLGLAILLAGKGAKVAIMDMDLGLANLDILMGVSPRFNLTHVMAGQKKITEIVVPGPNDIMFVPGASGVSRLANLNAKEREELSSRFSELEALADLLIIDTGAGLGENILHFALASQSLVVVTTAEPTSRMDAYALIKTALLRSPSLNIYILVNEVSGESEAQSVYHSLSDVCRQHLSQQPTYLGFVPRDNYVSRAVSKRNPFVLEYPHCPATRAMEQVAVQAQKFFLPHCGGLEDRQRSSFFSRLFSAFSGRPA
jgi:flagellar biosynthesis protein FlhG